MKKRIYVSLAVLLLTMGAVAQRFTYNYRGVDFNCKIKKGKMVIYGFSRDADKVVVPAEVKDEKGKTYPVSVINLFSEYALYPTQAIAIEPGIQEIADGCFFQFRHLTNIYIPSSVERIGKKAFNSKHLPVFNMPSIINEQELAAGKTVYPHAIENAPADPMADLDLSAYVDDPSKLQPSAPVTVEEVAQPTVTPGTSDIDYNIPTTNANRSNTFCVIIANENYKQKDTPSVKYAAQDGKTFQNYCIRTLGLPRENVKCAFNASYLQMKGMITWMQQIGEVYGNEANFIVYYAGHGVPDEKGNCKLIPADVSINDVNNGFSLKELYEMLGKITTNSALVLIDACFSGNDREDVAALDENHRGVAHELKKDVVSGNVVAITAASGSETALAFDEKAHGLFSYYLIKKLQETKGNVSYGELYNYIKKEVMRKSIVAKGKKQTPSVVYSPSLSKQWETLKF